MVFSYIPDNLDYFLDIPGEIWLFFGSKFVYILFKIKKCL